MRKTRVRATTAAVLLGTAIALIPVGAPAGANHLCNARSIEIPGPSGTLFYIQDRVEPGSAVPAGGIVSGEGTWIYMESNGKPKLQNWGAWPGPLAAENKDICTGSGAADTLIL